MNLKSFLLSMLLGASTILSAQKVAGVDYTDYGCGEFSGAMSFNSNKDASAYCLDCDEPYLLIGKWSIQGNEVVLTANKLWTIKNKKASVSASNRVLKFPSKHFKNEEYSDGCTAISFPEDKNRNIDPHRLFRTEFEGEYTFTKDRLITYDDIADLSKKELRIMRNEIYARYGHTFKSKDLKDYFNNQENYQELVEDAAVFLSPIESQNADFIKRYE